MIHDSAHIAAIDIDGHSDVVFQKTVAVTDWYLDGGDGHPLGSLQTIGKVQSVTMNSWVLDPHCEAHDLDNLWVVDAGFFPSSAAMNPALTIAAQALRVVAETDLAG